jgi:tetratricopeptide (TPR) repeat protein
MRLSPLDPLGYTFAGGLALAHVAARQYEKAAEWADRSLREQPRYSVAIRIKMVALAHLGRIEEAGSWLKRLLELQPGLTIARWKASYGATFFTPELLAVYVEGLREAGLPEE